MNKITRCLVGLAIIWLLCGTLYAQGGLFDKNFEKVGQAGFKFLSIGMGARQTAMGEAAATEEGDASALFWNPAGIAPIEGISGFVGYTSWLIDTRLQAAGAVMSFGKIGKFGVHALMMDYGDIYSTSINTTNTTGYNDLGTIQPASYAVGVSFARSLTDKFQFGITGKFCVEDLVAKSTSSEAFDFGTIYHAGAHGIKIAVTMQNFSFHKLQYVKEEFTLPLTFHVGIGADLLSFTGLKMEKSELVSSIEAVKPKDGSERIHLGAEYCYNEMLALRSGYRFNYDTGGLTMGVGFKISRFELGYSYADFGEHLNTASRLSVLFSF